MIDFTNIEAAGVDKVILYEDKGITYLRADISEPLIVGQINSSGTVDEISSCIDVKFSRDISLGENYEQLKDDELEFSIKNFNKDNKELIKRIQENRNGYIALIYFLNGDVTILQSPLFFQNESEKSFNNNFFSIPLKYRVKCGAFDLKKEEVIFPIQTLFDEDIDFNNNIVPDSVNGYNASLLVKSPAPTDNTELYPETASPINLNQDWTYIIKFYGTNDIGRKFLLANEASFGCNIYANFPNDNKIRWYFNGTGSIADSTTIETSGLQTFVVRRTGNVFTIDQNKARILTTTKEITFTNSVVKIGDSQQVFPMRLTSFAFMQVALSDSEVLEIGTSALKIREKVLEYDAISSFYPVNESGGNVLYDILRGYNFIKRNTTTMAWENNILGFATNLKYGYEQYIDDATGLLSIFVPLNNEGQSLGETISGYTSKGIVTQIGNGFLNCGTNIRLIEPINNDVISADIYELYQIDGITKEVSFEDIENYSQDNLTKTELENSIINISLYSKM